jgi:hypothetical protein
MFGDEGGYRAQIIVADILATVSEPALVAAAVSTGGGSSTTFGILAFVPVTLTAPIVHLAHGRVIPAVISFFAWPALAGTTFLAGGIAGLAQNRDGSFNGVAAWVVGLTFGAAGATGLTALDAYFARDITKREDVTHKTPVSMMLTPTRGGAIASIGGAF